MVSRKTQGLISLIQTDGNKRGEALASPLVGSIQNKRLYSGGRGCGFKDLGDLLECFLRPLCLWLRIFVDSRLRWVLAFLPVSNLLSVLPDVPCPETVPARARSAPSTAAVSGLFLLLIH